MAQRPANIFMAYLFQLLLIVMLLPSAAFGEQVLKIGGVGCVLGSMKILAAAFEKSHPGVKVKVLPSLGTSGSLKAVHQGAIDIGIEQGDARAARDGDARMVHGGGGAPPQVVCGFVGTDDGARVVKGRLRGLTGSVPASASSSTPRSPSSCRPSRG